MSFACVFVCICVSTLGVLRVIGVWRESVLWWLEPVLLPALSLNLKPVAVVFSPEAHH